MTEPSSSAAVGRATIDAYLESVERALLAASAPYGDRLQVLQDLESQIADMLAQQPSPLTEEAVQGVIATLEPPRHFAAMYGTLGQDMRSAPAGRPAWMPYNRWVLVAAASCALVPLGCLFLMFAGAEGVRGPAVGFLAMLLIVGCALTPIALWKGFKQLRAEPGRFLGREVALRTLLGYCSAVPLLLLVGACLATRGYVLFPLGVTAFAYMQYVLVRRAWRFMAEALPPQATPGSVRENGDRDASAPAGFAAGMSMAAL